jgi:hypothetical protein
VRPGDTCRDSRATDTIIASMEAIPDRLHSQPVKISPLQANNPLGEEYLQIERGRGLWKLSVAYEMQLPSLAYRLYKCEVKLYYKLYSHTFSMMHFVGIYLLIDGKNIVDGNE